MFEIERILRQTLTMTDTECPVCQESFDDGPARPRVTVCPNGHVICGECRDQVCSMRGSCPVCRSPLHGTEATIDQIIIVPPLPLTPLLMPRRVYRARLTGGDLFLMCGLWLPLVAVYVILAVAWSRGRLSGDDAIFMYLATIFVLIMIILMIAMTVDWFRGTGDFA